MEDLWKINEKFVKNLWEICEKFVKNLWKINERLMNTKSGARNPKMDTSGLKWYEKYKGKVIKVSNSLLICLVLLGKVGGTKWFWELSQNPNSGNTKSQQ